MLWELLTASGCEGLLHQDMTQLDAMITSLRWFTHRLTGFEHRNWSLRISKPPIKPMVCSASDRPIVSPIVSLSIWAQDAHWLVDQRKPANWTSAWNSNFGNSTCRRCAALNHLARLKLCPYGAEYFMRWSSQLKLTLTNRAGEHPLAKITQNRNGEFPTFRCFFFCWKRGFSPGLSIAQKNHLLWGVATSTTSSRLAQTPIQGWISGVDWLKNLKNSGILHFLSLFGESKSLSSS